MYCHPLVQGSPESQSLNSLEGSKMEPPSGCFWGALSSPPPVYLPSSGGFVLCSLCFVKTPLIVLKWFLQPPLEINKWSLICVLSILNLSLRCLCC